VGYLAKGGQQKHLAHPTWLKVMTSTSRKDKSLYKKLTDVDTSYTGDEEDKFISGIFSSALIQILEGALAQHYPEYMWKKRRPAGTTAQHVFGTETAAQSTGLRGNFPICRTPDKDAGYVKNGRCYARRFSDNAKVTSEDFQFLWKVRGTNEWIDINDVDDLSEEAVVVQDGVYLCRDNTPWRKVGQTKNSQCYAMGYRNEVLYAETDYSVLKKSDL